MFDSIAQEMLIYYRCKLHDTTATDRRFGGGMSAGLFGATTDEQVGRSSQSSGLVIRSCFFYLFIRSSCFRLNGPRGVIYTFLLVDAVFGCVVIIRSIICPCVTLDCEFNLSSKSF